jgi:pilus assembly protein Flp/PilA
MCKKRSAERSWASRRERGQGMTEYIIIVALIAIGSIFLVTAFGDRIRALFGTSANALSGEHGTIQSEAIDEGQVKKDLKTFNDAP